MKKRSVLPLWLSFFAVLCGVGDAGQKSISPTATHARPEVAPSLKWFNGLIGSWRGVGQLKRGSRKGAWSEKLECAWDFEGRTAVSFRAQGGRQFEELSVQWNSETNLLEMIQRAEGHERLYQESDSPDGKTGSQTRVLISRSDSHTDVLRCTIRQLSDIRATVLFEKKTTPSGSFRRVAAIGYTRAGAKLAKTGGNQRTCVVTGGLGTIPVHHEGQTYYVCCQGCLQAFNAAPDEILAEYRASLKKD